MWIQQIPLRRRSFITTNEEYSQLLSICVNKFFKGNRTNNITGAAWWRQQIEFRFNLELSISWFESLASPSEQGTSELAALSSIQQSTVVLLRYHLTNVRFKNLQSRARKKLDYWSRTTFNSELRRRADEIHIQRHISANVSLLNLIVCLIITPLQIHWTENNFSLSFSNHCIINLLT